MRAIRDKAWCVWPLFRLTRYLLTQRIGWVIPDWPKLLHLYSRFRAGKTVRDWMEEFDVHKLGIDVRRFTSFGVIKASATMMELSTFTQTRIHP